MAGTLQGANIIIADDESAIRELLRDLFEPEGARVDIAGSGLEVLELFQAQQFDLALLDIRMPSPDGLDLLRLLRAQGNDLPVLIITGQDSSTATIEAMQEGAYDYITKPFQIDEVLIQVLRALEYRRLTQRVHTLEEQINREDILIGYSKPMQQIYKLAGRVVKSEATIYITGERGTGKKLLAHVLHNKSTRKGPFVVVNCAMSSENVLLRTLFGQSLSSSERPLNTSLTQIDRVVLRSVLIDKFSESELRTLCFDLPFEPRVEYDDLPGISRADKARELIVYCERRNLMKQLARQVQVIRPDIELMPPTSEEIAPVVDSIQQADKGTLLLTEVSELSLSLQRMLLRLLQEGTVEVNGRLITVDVRVMVTSSTDLTVAVNNGSFRDDLYYRLNVINLHLPPLRERIDDIPLLVKHFIKKFNQRNGYTILSIEDTALASLTNHTWLGNVQELENTIERAATVSNGIITIADLAVVQPSQERVIDSLVQVYAGKPLKMVLQKVGRAMIREALRLAKGNRRMAAQMLEIDESNIPEE